MGPIPAILTSVISLVFYAMVIAAVWKLFQIGTDLSEIKALLAEQRRAPAAVPVAPSAPIVSSAVSHTPPPVPAVNPVLAGPISLESAEALLREVAAESQALEAAERPKTTV